MFNLEANTNKNNKDDDKKWPYRMLITGPSGSGKTNALLNLTQKQNNGSPIEKIYLYAKDLSEPKYQFLIKKCEDVGIQNLNDASGFIEYSNTMGDVFSNIDDYNSKRKRKILIVFDDMIADIMTNNRFQVIIKELFIRCKKLNVSLLPKEVRLNSTHYLIMKIHNKRELQQIAINHSAGIDYKDFSRIYRNLTNKPYSFLTIDVTLPDDSPMRFRKNLLDSSL